MSATIDIRVMELLSARMCHDLISPVSAVSNGIELVTEFDEDMKGEAIALVGDSAEAAAKLLQFYRAAFGSARAADGGPLGLVEARQRTLDCIRSPRIVISWPDGEIDLSRSISRQGLKLLMNLVFAASDVLPGEGRIEVAMEPDVDGARAEIAVQKEGLALSDQFRAAFAGTAPTSDLRPKTVIAFFCSALAAELGRDLEVTDGNLGVNISCLLPWS